MLLVAAAPNELIAAKRLLRAGESKGAAEVAVANAEAAPLVDGLDLPDTASVLGYKEAGTAVVLAVVPLEKVPAWTCTRVLFVRLAIKRGVIAGNSACFLSSVVDDGAELAIIAGVAQRGIGCTVAGV